MPEQDWPARQLPSIWCRWPKSWRGSEFRLRRQQPTVQSSDLGGVLLASDIQIVKQPAQTASMKHSPAGTGGPAGKQPPASLQADEQPRQAATAAATPGARSAADALPSTSASVFSELDLDPPAQAPGRHQQAVARAQGRPGLFNLFPFLNPNRPPRQGN